MRIVQDLKDRLEGATVISINEVDERESICEFVVERKKQRSTFTLYATNLGSWVSNERDAHNSFVDVRELFDVIQEHHSDHNDFESDVFEAVENPMLRTVGFKCRKCSATFSVGLSAIKRSPYLEFFQTPERRAELARALSGLYFQNVEELKKEIAELRG